MTLYYGIDPGTDQNMAIAMHFGSAWTVRLTRISVGEIMHRAAHMQASVRDVLDSLYPPNGLGTPVIIMEWQRPLPTDKRPVNICDLSAFAGIALATTQEWLRRIEPRAPVYLPLPEEWKGSIKKWAKQNRIVGVIGKGVVTECLQNAGIPVPKNLGSFTSDFSGMAGNAIDAMGLCLWGRRKHELREKIGVRGHL